MARNYSAKDVYNWKFERLEMPEKWQDHLGNITAGFRMMIQGSPGNGKTEYLLQLTKMLANHFGKVHYNNVEQGRSATLQDAVIRNGMQEVKGKWMMAPPECRTFDRWMKRLERPNSGRIIALDSVDYMKLTFDQFKALHERFKHKSIIIVCWDDPMSPDSRKMKYMCDMKVKVKDFKANIVSRFGGNKTLTIWNQKPHSGQTRLFG